MRINLQDSSFIISYIQIFLKEYSGINIKKLISTKSQGVYTNDSYIISMNNPLKVTGIYDTNTYQATALYMAFNYPNEQFPTIWNVDRVRNTWISNPYEPDKLSRTLDKLIYECFQVTRGKSRIDETILSEDRGAEQSDNTIIYNDIIQDYSIYLSWSELISYFSAQGSVESLYNFLTDKTTDYSETFQPSTTGSFTREDLNKVLITIIINNINLSTLNKGVVELDERILSYLFNEVVSPLSDQDEIYRVQQLMYSSISLEQMGKFDNQMTEDVLNYQNTFLAGYQDIDLPEVYNGFKATGYIDPWTEKVIRNRGVLR